MNTTLGRQWEVRCAVPRAIRSVVPAAGQTSSEAGVTMITTLAVWLRSDEWGGMSCSASTDRIVTACDWLQQARVFLVST